MQRQASFGARAPPRSQTLFEGQLNKRNPNSFLGMYGWKQRYFILSTELLLYKKAVDDVEDTGACI